jgi:NitT/TauT family transport system ATP-binding protein
MLTVVGLGDYQRAYRGQLSQGMRQRVALARALVTRPKLLMLDEPFAALDSQTRVLVQSELLRMLEAQKDPVTTVMVTHDLAEAISLSDVVILMSRRPGTIREIYPPTGPRSRTPAGSSGVVIEVRRPEDAATRIPAEAVLRAD